MRLKKLKNGLELKGRLSLSLCINGCRRGACVQEAVSKKQGNVFIEQGKESKDFFFGAEK